MFVIYSQLLFDSRNFCRHRELSWTVQVPGKHLEISVVALIIITAVFVFQCLWLYSHIFIWGMMHYCIGPMLRRCWLGDTKGIRRLKISATTMFLTYYDSVVEPAWFKSMSLVKMRLMLFKILS